MSRHRNRGFTLVELLVSIVVLSLLVGLLLPAVMRAHTYSLRAAEAANIQSLETDLASFRNVFGTYPPSRIVVAEDGDYSANNLKSIPNNEGVLLAPRSLAAFRRFWPRMPLRTDGTKPKINRGWFDVNGDHTLNPPYIVYGHECLALFLGGVPEHAKDSVGVSGFDKDPTNPFTSPQLPPTGVTWPYGENRTTPFHDSRVVVTENSKVAFADGFGGWLAYFSSYNGSGYDPDDVNIAENDDDFGIANTLGAMQTNNAATPTTPTTRKDIVVSPAPNPYTEDAPIPVTATNALNLSENRRRIYYKDATYQIIAAGPDRLFGIGGQYNEKLPLSLPFFEGVTTVTGQSLLTRSVRIREQDNITSFAGLLK